MQAYAEGFNILENANAGSKYVKEGDAEVAPMENPRDYCYDIDVAEVAELWRRVVWLAVGCSILPLMFYGTITTSISSMGGSVILGRVVGLSMLLWILGYPLLLSVARCMNVLTRAVLVLSRPRF